MVPRSEQCCKLISYDNYHWQQAAADAMIHQMLRERSLQDNVSYDDMMKLGI